MRVCSAPPVGMWPTARGGMLKVAAQRLTRALYMAGGVRVAVHTYRIADDARRLMRLLP